MRRKNNQDERISQSNKINELEESNKNLQEKLKLLRIQLMSQSQLQLASFNHSRSASLSRSRTNLHSARQFHSTIGLRTDDHNKASPRKHPESILHQLSILQEELDTVKEQHKNRISELEKQIAKSQNAVSPTKLKLELNENVELIKLKRLSKKQAAQILSLQSQLEISNAELKQLQTNLISITSDRDNFQTELSNEKCESAKLQTEISTLKGNTKFLEEQVNDLLKEKTTLKEHNENLLKLSLQQKSTTSDANKSNLLKQIKELQENLQREILAKSELSSKLANTELAITKYKNEIFKNNSMISDLQSTNEAIKNEVERLKKRLNEDKIPLKSNAKLVATEDKSVMTELEDITDTKIWSENNVTSIAENSNNRDHSSLKIQLYTASQELNQCKELLRVQYGLNNKYKKEIEELQKIFQNNEKLSSENLKQFRTILYKHEERLSKIEFLEGHQNLKSIHDELRMILGVKKLRSYPDYLNSIEKMLNSYILLVENQKQTSNRELRAEKSVFDDTNTISKIQKLEKFVPGLDKFVQGELKNKEMLEISDDDRSVVTPNSNIKENNTNKTPQIIFELRIEKATFEHFSDHLMKSSGNNPKIFLTWNFLNDNEHQAYTPTIEVKEGIFDCSCQYEGPWSEFLHKYLKEHGIRVEIHFVQDDISIRLAETKIDTSSALDHPDEFQNFLSNFENDNIKGNVTGTFILRHRITPE